MTSITRRSLLQAALATATLGSLPRAARANVVNLAHLELTTHEVMAGVIQFVLERKWGNVAIHTGSPAQLYPKLATGAVDLFVAGSLPHGDQRFWKDYSEELVQVTSLYEDARSYWAVPDYVPASEVRTVADLRKPAVAQRMERTLRANSGDGRLQAVARSAFDHYGLAEAGYEWAPLATREWVGGIADQVGRKAWFATPMRRPHFLNRVHRLRMLEDPEGRMGKPDEAILLANRSYHAGLDRKQRILLSRLSLSLKAVTEMDYWVNVELMSARDAARRWVSTNPDTVTYWMAGPDEE